MARGLLCAALLLGACGRIGFAAPEGIGDDSGDDAGDQGDGGPGDGSTVDALLDTPTIRPVRSGSNLNSGEPVTLSSQFQHDMMVVVINVNSSTARVANVTDTTGNTFVSANVVSTSTMNPGGQVVSEIWYAPVGFAMIPDDVSVTTTDGSMLWDVTVLQISKLDESAPLEVAMAQSSLPGSTTSAPSLPVTVGQNSAIVVLNSGSNLNGLASGSAFQKFTTGGNDDVGYLVGAHAAGTYEADWVCSGACGQYNVSEIAFKAHAQ